MNFFKETEDQYTLIDSSINYCETEAYFSLMFLNTGELTLKSTDLLSVSDTSIYFVKDKKNIKISIDPKCDKEISKLQYLFKEAVLYESSIARSRSKLSLFEYFEMFCNFCYKA